MVPTPNTQSVKEFYPFDSALSMIWHERSFSLPNSNFRDRVPYLANYWSQAHETWPTRRTRRDLQNALDIDGLSVTVSEILGVKGQTLTTIISKTVWPIDMKFCQFIDLDDPYLEPESGGQRSNRVRPTLAQNRQLFRTFLRNGMITFF